jgi:hypothetical protein
MPFKVRGKLVGFMNDEEKFPCHFDYAIGEEFTYDGSAIEGRICPGVLLTMVPVVWQTFFSGNHTNERVIFRYDGLSAKDPGMKQYDGIGFRPLTAVPEGSGERGRIVTATERPRGMTGGSGFGCADCRTSAYFMVEPVDIASGGYTLPFYRRQMDILDRVIAKPGMTVPEILATFTEWEREHIHPVIYDVNTQLMLEELEQVGYVELRDGRAYPGSRPRPEKPV